MSRPPGRAKGFGKSVQAAQLDRGRPQDELAEKANVARPTVSRVELGENPLMRIMRLFRIYSALMTSLSPPEWINDRKM